LKIVKNFEKDFLGVGLGRLLLAPALNFQNAKEISLFSSSSDPDTLLCRKNSGTISLPKRPELCQKRPKSFPYESTFLARI
jgi:hypothetical protein